MIGWPQGR